MNSLTTANRELEIMRSLTEAQGTPANALVEVGLLEVDMLASSQPFELENDVREPEGKPPAVKDYLETEKARNVAAAELFRDIVVTAFGPSEDVSAGHHISFQWHGNLKSLNEIPSADTLIFDHEIMTRVFGKELALKHMALLATIPCDKRDGVLAVLFKARNRS